MEMVKVATWSEIPDRHPVGAMLDGIDLVIVRQGDQHSVLYGRCLHRGALLADGHVMDEDLICGVHGWDYRIESGVSAYNNAEALEKFTSEVRGDDLLVSRTEVLRFAMRHPQPFDADVYQGYYQDPHMVPEEPFVAYIHELAGNGLTKTGHHGPLGAMGVPARRAPDAGTTSSSSPRSSRGCPSSTRSRSAPRSASVRTRTSPSGSTSPCSCRT